MCINRRPDGKPRLRHRCRKPIIRSTINTHAQNLFFTPTSFSACQPASTSWSPGYSHALNLRLACYPLATDKNAHIIRRPAYLIPASWSHTQWTIIKLYSGMHISSRKMGTRLLMCEQQLQEQSTRLYPAKYPAKYPALSLDYYCFRLNKSAPKYRHNYLKYGN